MKWRNSLRILSTKIDTKCEYPYIYIICIYMKVEFAIKNLPTNQIFSPGSCLGKSIKHLKSNTNTTQMLSENKGRLFSTSFYEGR